MPQPFDEHELALVGGRLVTMDEARPQASALLCRGGRIVAVGEEADVTALAGPNCRRLDLAGRVACRGSWTPTATWS